MPFRNPGAYVAAFADPNGFDFGYDMGSDGLMSPYGFPLMSPDSSWTPASQQFAAASNQSDSLSPLEINFTTPPQDQDLQYPPSASASVRSDENAAAARRSYLDMANADVRSHGQKRDASYLGTNSPTANLPASVPMATTQQTTATFSTSPPAVPVKSRQSSTDASTDGNHDDILPAALEGGARVRTTDSAKVRHNIVERRYRENINAQVDLLRESIVATVHAKEEQQGVSASRLGADELKRLTKAAVIAAATKQIRRARTENERLLDEHRSLQAQIQELESLVKCGDCPLMKLTVDLSLESPTQPP